jgi:hypothetical protein
VLARLRPNLIWDEQNLSIINTKPIQSFINGLAEAKSKNPQLEPRNIVDTSDSNEDFRLLRPTLLRVLDRFRTLDWTKIKSDLIMVNGLSVYV